MEKRYESFREQWESIQVQCKSAQETYVDNSFHDTTNAIATVDESVVTSQILVSNPAVPFPDGLFYRNDIISRTEESTLLNEISQRDFVWEGFDQRRRVQRYHLHPDLESVDTNDTNHYKNSNRIPEGIVLVQKRVEQLTGLKASKVAIEEYSTDKSSKSKEHTSNNTVTVFEGNLPGSTQCSDTEGYCQYFVAQITLGAEAIQHFNKPIKRQANCWSLHSSHHWTDVLMEQRSVFVKTGEFLHYWRSRIAAAPNCGPDKWETECIPRVGNSEPIAMILRFYMLPDERITTTTRNENDEIEHYGYQPSLTDRVIPPDCQMPPLKDLLTIVVTTSPIKSNPSTELLERAMETFVFGGSDFAYSCRKVIICDGCRLRTDDDKPDEYGNRKVSSKYANAKQAMRNGIVTGEQGDNYSQFKENLKRLCTENVDNSTSPFYNAVVVELEERHGYGYALRHALRHCVQTEFVCVVQHDRTLMRPTPIVETVNAMWRHPRIKYVGMSMRSNLLYRDIFTGKYGRSYLKDFDETITRVPELVVDAKRYGPDSDSAKAMSCGTDKLQLNINALVETYRASAHSEIPQVRAVSDDGISEDLVGQPTTCADGKQQILLIPTLFWYDNVHICETAHYRDFIFNRSYKMVARGGFVEDKLSPVMKRTVERLGFKDGHSRFGCFLLDDASGMFFTGHLDGGSYLTSTEREKIRLPKNGSSSI